MTTEEKISLMLKNLSKKEKAEINLQVKELWKIECAKPLIMYKPNFIDYHNI